MEDAAISDSRSGMTILPTRAYQQEMLDMSLAGNIIIALDTGSGKTHIAILRIKHEIERQSRKLCWFVAPTVALCEQQHAVISAYLPISVGLVSGAHYPDQWKNAKLWKMVTDTHRVMVSTPQVLLDALRHGYMSLGEHIGLLVFDEAHHAVDKHPYNMIMQEFYFSLPVGQGAGLCRPGVLGLSASPIYGSGDIDKALRTIESNLDSAICTPHYNRDELSRFVHRPIFKHAPYFPPNPDDPPFSTNLAALSNIIKGLDIEKDPYVISLRRQLARAAPASPAPPSKEYLRLDQKLSKVLSRQDSFTHKGLRDLERAATDILFSIGPWAADWFVGNVVAKAKLASNPFNNVIVMSNWKNEEKRYLGSVLGQLVLSPVSYYADDIVEGSLDKVNVLIQCLLDEKEWAEGEGEGEGYSGLVFVQRRDAVLALAEVLRHHPASKDQFEIGILLGSSDSAHRHSMMDITRALARDPAQSQATTLAEFKIGQKNLIVSTSVAEEGIDIQACGSVIRWDPPLNMASWVQSRGRARKQKSTFTLMYDVEEDRHQGNVEKWKRLEEQMRGMMVVDPNTGVVPERVGERDGQVEPGDWDMVLRVEATGATINPHSAVSHLSHFCSVISRSGSEDNRPIYDIDPPDFFFGWHTPAPGQSPSIPLYQGPWASTVTLPRSLPIPQRVFTTERIYSSKLAAHRHAAFKAYEALNTWGLLNENLLPFTGGMDEEMAEEVKRMLSDVERREGLKKVGVQVDPWAPLDQSDTNDGGQSPISISESENGSESVWYQAELRIDNLPPLVLFTRRLMVEVKREDGPKLYRPGRPVVRASVVPASSLTLIADDDPLVEKARVFSRMVFWCFYSSRMVWDKTDYAYLVLPVDHRPGVWDERRAWLEAEQVKEGNTRPERHFLVKADMYAEKWGYGEEMTIVRKHMAFGTGTRFVGWQWDKLDEEEEEAVREGYGSKKQKKSATTVKKGRPVLEEADQNANRDDKMDVEEEMEKMEIPYPLMIVEAFPPRSNFLHPLPEPKVTKEKEKEEGMDIDKVPVRTYLIPHLSAVALYSPEETEFGFLLPSVLRWLGNHLTVASFQDYQFGGVAPLPSSSLSNTASSTSSSTLSTISSSPSTSSASSPLLSISRSLLTVALTAPVSGERYNYQRLETLGDTVLKYMVGLQLYAEYPMWHEGYLTRGKDHAVSNVRLAKENFLREVFRWIMRDMMLGKKWLPKYVEAGGAEEAVGAGPGGTVVEASGEAGKEVVQPEASGPSDAAMDTTDAGKVESTGDNARDKVTKGKKRKGKKGKGKTKGKSQQLSTKVLADVIESLIGAAFEHGGFNLGYECVKFFDLGVKWQPISARLDQILSNVPADDALGDMHLIPSQITDVERMIGYTFKRKILLIEALTHASYREHVSTISYERMEFLGDGILDMVATDYLYHAPGGKEYSPGHMHMRKSAVVNGHFLAYICLGMKHVYDAVIPQPASAGSGSSSAHGDGYANPRAVRMEFVAGVDRQEIHLWQCLLHSNQQVLDDQTNTYTRYVQRKDEIRDALENGSVFPWAALTRLQAPKFFSDMVESIIGAVYVDSRGDMDVIKNLLRGIGILPVLERIVRDDVDVLHPVSRLSMWASRNEKEIEYVFEKERGNVACVIMVDGVEEVRETERFRGKSSQEEVKYAAAEKAIALFKLRSGGQETKKKKKPTVSRNKGKGREW